MKIAFYKINEKSKFLDYVICFLTCTWKERLTGAFLKTYSHCEIIDENRMISASARDKGVRIKEFRDNGHWDFIEIKDLNEAKIKAFLYTQLGKKYDFLGILGFISFTKDNEKQWFCSELCLRALQIGGCVELGALNANNTSPNRLYRELKELLNYS